MKSFVFVATFLFLSTAAHAQQRVQGCSPAQAAAKAERVVEAKFFKENRRVGRAQAQPLAVTLQFPAAFAFEVAVGPADGRIGIPVNELYELTLNSFCQVILGPTLIAVAQ